MFARTLFVNRSSTVRGEDRARQAKILLARSRSERVILIFTRQWRNGGRKNRRKKLFSPAYSCGINDSFPFYAFFINIILGRGERDKRQIPHKKLARHPPADPRPGSINHARAFIRERACACLPPPSRFREILSLSLSLSLSLFPFSLRGERETRPFLIASSVVTASRRP